MARQPIKQKHTNDCTIAAVAMVTGVPYHKCERIVRARSSWRPGSKTGVSVQWLLSKLGYLSKVHFGTDLAPHVPWRTPIGTRRAVLSVRSINQPAKDSFHAVALINGRVFDPSKRRQVSVARVRLRTSLMYIPRKKSP